MLPPDDGRYRRFMPVGASWTREQLDALDGLSVHDVMLLPIERVRLFFDKLSFTGALDAATDLLMTEVRARLKFLCDVGLGYLTLDRQSRTLSGGEVQRINLTTALGTSLVNTLFVLDEPSIGLHPRDMHRVVEVMHRLRNAGNTLVVVEHDPQVMVAADRVIDIGPGPGERGGRIVFDGTPAALRAAPTLTGDYLGSRLRVEAPRPMPVAANTPRLILEGVSAHNLKNVSVELPLGRLVCVTGVSGSGKSTLVQDVLYPALLKQKGKPTEAPGAFQRLLGAEQIADVVMVDQTPIGKTARSNPASYVGAFDAIRKLFAQAPLARERGYTAGTFSFNGGDGRCPTCGGTGFEHVEMQFLSDVYLRCPDCDGKRFRPEVLEVRVEHLGKSASIDEVLEMTVSEALDFFKGLRDVQTGLAPLGDVGLEYVRLGQPVPTLSGGEAQRLKLAGHLAEAARSGISTAKVAKKGSLFLFDEPTTGLHFDDVARLMRAFRKLLAAGHTLLVIEHNLDVIRAADWLIDLGPEGGDAGGLVIGAGTPQDLMDNPKSHTGAALRDYETSILPTPVADVVVSSDIDAQEAEQAGLSARIAEPDAPYGAGDGTPLQSLMRARRQSAMSIEIRNAREHNLKNVNVEIPRDKFTVITGVSGSGKSTLAFDILFNEGQRRYLESLNAYARAIVQPAGKPDVDAIFGIPPTVAIEQRTSRGGRKSTVATMTEIHHFLRLLYVKLGTQYCPDCNVAVEPQNTDQIVARLLRERRGEHIGLLAPLVTARKGYYTDLAKWAGARGHSHLRVDGQFIPVAPWLAPGSLQGTHHRAAGGGRGGRSGQRGRAARRGQERAGERPGRDVRGLAGEQAARGAGQRPAATTLLGQARLPVLRHQLPRTRSAPVLVQLQARLVHRLLRHRPATAGLRRGADRRGNRLERLVRRRGQGLHAVRWPAPEPRRPRRALARQVDRRTGLAAGVGRAHLLHRAGGARPRGRDRPRHPHRDPRPPELHAGSRPELPGAGPRRTHAVRRRGAAHPAGRAAGLEPAGRVLCAGRAHHRPAPARQPHPAGRAGAAGRQRQHAGGGRA